MSTPEQIYAWMLEDPPCLGPAGMPDSRLNKDSLTWTMLGVTYRVIPIVGLSVRCDDCCFNKDCHKQPKNGRGLTPWCAGFRKV